MFAARVSKGPRLSGDSELGHQVPEARSSRGSGGGGGEAISLPPAVAESKFQFLFPNTRTPLQLPYGLGKEGHGPRVCGQLESTGLHTGSQSTDGYLQNSRKSPTQAKC